MKVDIQIGLNYRYQLRHALLIYGGNSGNHNGAAFVTLHDVLGQDTPTLGPAQPLSSKFLAALSCDLRQNAGVEIRHDRAEIGLVLGRGKRGSRLVVPCNETVKRLGGDQDDAHRSKRLGERVTQASPGGCPLRPCLPASAGLLF